VTKEEFYDVVKKLVVPLFTGSYLAGEIESSSRDLEVALGKGSSILLKPTRADDYRLVLKRGQAFKAFEVNLIRSIVNELNLVSLSNVQDGAYLAKMQSLAIEKALVESIADGDAANTILSVINNMEKWATRTYEGSKISLGVMVNMAANNEDHSVHCSSVLNSEFFALFTNGTSSFVEFDSKGYMLGYVALKNPRHVATIAPYKFGKVAKVCNDKRIGIILTEMGDILIFYARQLMYARRNGNWCVYCHDEIIRLLQNNVSYTAKMIRRAIYNTALDCSFAYNGACVVYLNNDTTTDALIHINAADIVSEDHFNVKKKIELEEAGKLYNLGNARNVIDQFSMSYSDFLETNNYVKTMTMRKIISGRKIFELDRKLIEEMTSVDGATIIDHDGTIIAVGAIVKIDAGSDGGGRLAAAKTMAKYGVSIKVSQDGAMQGFTYDKKKNKVRQIFYVG